MTPTLDTYNETSQSKRSRSLRVPYYFNLAPDRDLIFALTYMSSRGLIYEGKYRQLIAPGITEEDEDCIGIRIKKSRESSFTTGLIDYIQNVLYNKIEIHDQDKPSQT